MRRRICKIVVEIGLVTKMRVNQGNNIAVRGIAISSKRKKKIEREKEREREREKEKKEKENM
jgi:hypothetical protein